MYLLQHERKPNDVFTEQIVLQEKNKLLFRSKLLLTLTNVPGANLVVIPLFCLFCFPGWDIIDSCRHLRIKHLASWSYRWEQSQCKIQQQNILTNNKFAYTESAMTKKTRGETWISQASIRSPCALKKQLGYILTFTWCSSLFKIRDKVVCYTIRPIEF